MTKTYVGYLIEDLRRTTENEEFSELVGIPNRDFLRYMNDAQFRIHSLIVNKHPQVYIKDKVFTSTQGIREYDIPFDAHLDNQISNVMFREATYSNYRLKPDVIANNTINDTNTYARTPSRYYRRSGKVILDVAPQCPGVLTVTYVRSVPKLDLRRGQVSAVTLGTDNTITTLTLDTVTQQIDADALTRTTRICVVDDEGNINMSNIRITAVNATTGEVSVHSDHVFEDGETISIGDYITVGPLSSTHIQLDPVVERYVMSYATTKILQQEGSEELVPEANTLGQMEADIVASYADISDDFTEIVDINDDDWY